MASPSITKTTNQSMIPTSVPAVTYQDSPPRISWLGVDSNYYDQYAPFDHVTFTIEYVDYQDVPHTIYGLNGNTNQGSFQVRDVADYPVKEVNTIIADFYYTGLTRTITANANSGTITNFQGWSQSSSSVATKTFTNGTTYGAFPTVSKTGFIHNGGMWGTSTTGGTVVTSTSVVWLSGNTTFYAQWAYQVIYNANGGSSAPAADTKAVGQIATITSQIPQSSGGLYFKGWNTSSDGTGTAYNAGDTYNGSQSGSLTLYAQWGELTTDINLDVVYAPMFPSPTTIFDETTNTWTLNFQAYPAEENNGYFNSFKVEYNNIYSDAKYLNFQSSSQTVILTRNGSNLYFGQDILLSNLPSSGDCTVNFVCCCTLGNQASDLYLGKSISLLYSDTPPATNISSVEISYPNSGNNTAYLQSNYQNTNVCFSIELTNALPGEEISIEHDGVVTSYIMSQSAVQKLKLTDIQLESGNNEFIISFPNLSPAPTPYTVTLNCIKLNYGNYSQINSGEIVQIDVLRNLLDEVKKITSNYSQLDEVDPGDTENRTYCQKISDSAQSLLEYQLISNGLICDGLNYDSDSFYPLTQNIIDLYNYMTSGGDVFLDENGQETPPSRINGLSITVNPSQRYIVADEVSPVNDSVQIKTNYQKSILYIINNIF